MEHSGSYHTVQLKCIGVVIEVKSNHEPLINYIKEHVRPLVQKTDQPKPHVHIQIHWQEVQDGKGFPLLNLAETRDAQRVGKRLYRVDTKFLWTDIIRAKNMVLLFSLKEDRLRLQYDYYFELPQKKLDRNPDYRYEKYFSLLKYFLYFPLIWYQEQFYQRYLLHASGVILNDSGIALGGVGGVGKTTACIALLSHPHTKLLSENLIFYDENNLYQLYEPIRLDDHSLGLLDNNKKALLPANLPEGTRAKKLFHIHPSYLKEQATARLVILPEFASNSETRLLSAKTAFNSLENYNMLTREVNDYYWFAATLNLLRPSHSITRQRQSSLQKLLDRVPAYQLLIDRSKGTEPVVREIKNLTKGN